MISRLKRLIGQRSFIRLLWHRAKAFLAALRYGFPAGNLTVIAVTGTDGKTTTVAMLAHILHKNSIAVGAVSTSFLRIKERVRENPTHKTSLSPFALQKFLRECEDVGCNVVVIEASSHGLVQHRLDFLWPSVAAITNTSPEHLDYHGTMERYRNDKAILFRMLRGKGTKVLNAKDETLESYSKIPSERTISYSLHSPHPSPLPLSRERGEEFLFSPLLEGEGEANGVSEGEGELLIEGVDGGSQKTNVKIQLLIPGTFNIENALCAIGCARAAGVPVQKSSEALQSFAGVAGRLEKIDEGQHFSVYVNFTVTPRSYEVTLAAIRKILAPGKRLLVLTGSCGDRMREKRPQIGKICGELADVVVVSEDETLTEDPMKVIDEVYAGIDQSKTSAHKIPDRREAINFLFQEAKPGDAVILCGMGACTTMQTREGLRPWDERKIARELLREIL